MSALVLQPPLPTVRRRHLSLVPPLGAPRPHRPARAEAPATAPLRSVGPAPHPGPGGGPHASEHPGTPGHAGSVHVTRRGRLVVTVSTLLLVAGAVTAAAASATAPTPTAPGAAVPPSSVPAATAEVVVLPGDTLWSVADEVAAPGQDVRDVVLRIEQLNALSSSALAVGERLLVPTR